MFLRKSRGRLEVTVMVIGGGGRGGTRRKGGMLFGKSTARGTRVF